MFVRKTLVVSLLAGSSLVAAQGPVGTGSLPAGLGETLPLSASGQSSLDPEPLLNAATPGGSASADFSVTEFLAGSIIAETNSASLPGLVEQIAAFVQNQGGGGDPSAPAAPEVPSAPETPELADNPASMEGGGDAAPDVEGFVSAISNVEPPSQQELETRASAVQTQLTSVDKTLMSVEAPMPPEAPSGSSAPSTPSAPDGGSGGAMPAPQTPAVPDGGSGSDMEGVAVSVGVPSDIEEQSPLPQPFLVSGIANVTVSAKAQNPSGSGGGEAPAAPEAPEAPAPEL